jgi:hypothetical protein
VAGVLRGTRLLTLDERDSVGELKAGINGNSKRGRSQKSVCSERMHFERVKSNDWRTWKC